MSAATRHVETVCPAWCAGHDDDGFFQGWEVDLSGSPFRTHAGNLDPVVASVGVDLSATEGLDGLSHAAVVVYLDRGEDERLTPAQARQLAAALLEAADVIEAANG